MDQAMVAEVRRFNRTVTQRVGALRDRYLSRGRSLGECRLLWEIGADGSDVRTLRRVLDLDSAYVSRLLRSLEAAGLVQVSQKESDRRVRIARLTSAGAAEVVRLDHGGDLLAASMLAPLNTRQRERLVSAMAEVERLLTAGTVQVSPLDPAHPDARHCLREYFAEIDRRFEAGFDPAQSLPIDDAELRPPAGLFIVARLRGEAIGCGALKFYDDEPAYIKRMWVARSARRLGVGRRLLTELEVQAAEHGERTVRLETNQALSEAINLYRSAGYTEVAPFNDEAYAHHWFEKPLVNDRSRELA